MNWNIFNFLRPKPEPAKLPSILLELLEDDIISISIQWPRPESEEEANETANRTASMLALLTTGKLTADIQHAVAVCGEARKERGMAKAVQARLTTALVAISGDDSEDDDDLVVDPTKVFVVNKEDKDDD